MFLISNLIIQVRAEGSVEIWINNLLRCAREAVHCIIRCKCRCLFYITFLIHRQCFHYINDNQFTLLEMVNKFQAQICILGIQMVWTRDAENALGSCRVDKKIMGDTNTKFLDMLNLLISQTTKNLEKMERKKYETLITVHMHQRDVFEAIVKTNVKHTLDFEWLKQARYKSKL